MNITATFSGDARLRPATNFDFTAAPPPVFQGLQYVRASGLAQARLQLAILSGDRRRALREIDRLVEIDRQLARVSRRDASNAGGMTDAELEAHLDRQRSAIGSERLALLAGVEFPRLPERGELDLGEMEEQTVVVEDTAMGRKLGFAGFWLAALIVLGTALTIALPTLAAAL